MKTYFITNWQSLLASLFGNIRCRTKLLGKMQTNSFYYRMLTQNVTNKSKLKIDKPKRDEKSRTIRKN